MPLLSLTVVFSVKDLFYEKSSLVFSVYHIAVLPSELMTLNFILGDNFFDIFFYDTFFALFSFQGTNALRESLRS